MDYLLLGYRSEIQCSIRIYVGLIPRNRSERRRSSSTVASKAIETVIRMVATAKMVGLICSRIPTHI